jgi:hypothetical protein
MPNTRATGMLKARRNPNAITNEATNVPCIVRLLRAFRNAPQNDLWRCALREWPKWVTNAYSDSNVNIKCVRIEFAIRPTAGGKYCVFGIFSYYSLSFLRCLPPAISFLNNPYNITRVPPPNASNQSIKADFELEIGTETLVINSLGSRVGYA